LPQALRVLRICPRSQPRSVQAVRPSAAIARLRQFAPEKVCSSIEASHVLSRSAKLPVGFVGVSHGGLASSLSIHLQVQLKRRSCSLCLQRWYASPSKFKARLRLTERGLTLPSSGRAFGTPLKSNVRALSLSTLRRCSSLPQRVFVHGLVLPLCRSSRHSRELSPLPHASARVVPLIRLQGCGPKAELATALPVGARYIEAARKNSFAAGASSPPTKVCFSATQMATAFFQQA